MISKKKSLYTFKISIKNSFKKGVSTIVMKTKKVEEFCVQVKSLSLGMIINFKILKNSEIWAL